ncbi:YdeI/OmpD-associated family protein [Algivirga pacifica]
MNTEQVLKKLRIPNNGPFLLLNAPEQMKESILQAFPNTHTSVTEDAYEAILIFVHEKKEIKEWGTKGLKHMSTKGILWFAYPKKSSGVKTDISRDQGWDFLERKELVPVSQVAIDDTWSALRFRAVKEVSLTRRVQGGRRPAIEVPDVLKEALDRNPEASAFFNKLAYTYRKEYAQWIGSAKKEETIQQRVAKAIELLQKEQKLK